jgi:tRNA (guanine37-N1)-methyltransferase
VKFAVVSVLPELVTGSLQHGVVGKAANTGKIDVSVHNPRDHTQDVHRTVDDRPFGGGPGMLLRPEPTGLAIQEAKQKLPDASVVYLSPQGRRFDQPLARRWGEMGSLILLCGRYEGIDERIIDQHVDDEVSIGDFVLSRGELAAAVIIDVVSRLQSGVLGHPKSAEEDSFESNLLDYPHYTRPETYNGQAVPDVLRSGDHAKIALWRRQQSIKRTLERRPDLLRKADLEETDKQYLQQFGGHSPTNTTGRKK